MNETLTDRNQILIVEDENDLCFFLSELLRKRNIKSIFVNTKKEARKEFETSYPHILFLDNHLPDGYGIDLVKEVKEDSPDTSIIMISAHDSEEDRGRAYREGVDYFLSKPFTIVEVNSAIDMVLSKRKTG